MKEEKEGESIECSRERERGKRRRGRRKKRRKWRKRRWSRKRCRRKKRKRWREQNRVERKECSEGVIWVACIICRNQIWLWNALESRI